MCQVNGTSSGSSVSWEPLTNNGTYNSSIGVSCPFIEDQTIPRSNVTSIWADVYNSNSHCGTAGAAEWTCIQDNSDTGSSCSTYTNLLSCGHNSTNLNTSGFDTAYYGDLGTIEVSLTGGVSLLGVQYYTN